MIEIEVDNSNSNTSTVLTGDTPYTNTTSSEIIDFPTELLTNANDSQEQSERRSTTESKAVLKRKKRSWVWKHFREPEHKSQREVLCLLCTTFVNYEASKSSGMLERHIERSHYQQYRKSIEQGEKKRPKVNHAGCQPTMREFVTHCPDFENCLLEWVIQTYQPLKCVEDESFRKLCISLNKKAPFISRAKFGSMVMYKFTEMQQKMTAILLKRYLSITTDSWTSRANQSYTACTVHFIDKKTWKLHSFILGLLSKEGTSTAIDTVKYIEKQLEIYMLSYKYMLACVTDTESTMIAAGRLIQEHATNDGGNTKWHGCIDHLIELITGKSKVHRFLVAFPNPNPPTCSNNFSDCRMSQV
jgi:hypothetical protein